MKCAAMATSGKSYTAPKGKATGAPATGRSGLSPTLEWVLWAVVAVVVLVAVLWLGRGLNDDTPHTGSGPPAAAAVVAPPSS